LQLVNHLRNLTKSYPPRSLIRPTRSSGQKSDIIKGH
jgi:hypothetical protein